MNRLFRSFSITAMVVLCSIVLLAGSTGCASTRGGKTCPMMQGQKGKCGADCTKPCCDKTAGKSMEDCTKPCCKKG